MHFPISAHKPPHFCFTFRTMKNSLRWIYKKSNEKEGEMGWRLQVFNRSWCCAKKEIILGEECGSQLCQRLSPQELCQSEVGVEMGSLHGCWVMLCEWASLTIPHSLCSLMMVGFRFSEPKFWAHLGLLTSFHCLNFEKYICIHFSSRENKICAGRKTVE